MCQKNEIKQDCSHEKEKETHRFGNLDNDTLCVQKCVVKVLYSLLGFALSLETDECKAARHAISAFLARMESSLGLDAYLYRPPLGMYKRADRTDGVAL